MSTEKKEPGKFIGWIKTHKVAASCITGAVVIALGVGGVFAYNAITTPTVSAAETEYVTTAEGWDAAKADFDAAVAKHDAAVKKTEKARTDGVESQKQVKAIVASATAAKLDTKALSDIDKKMTDALATSYGVVEGDKKFVPVKTTTPDVKPELVEGDDTDYVTFTGKLQDDIREFESATKKVNDETKKIDAFIDDLTGDQIAQAYLKIAPSVVTHGESVQADVSKLKAAVSKKKVTAQDITDAFAAIAAKTGETPVAPGTEPGTQPDTNTGTDNGGGDYNNGGGDQNNGNTGNQNNGGNQNNNDGGGTTPPPPPVTEPPVENPNPPVTNPDPPSVSINATEGVSGSCFQVGTASSSGGSVFVPGGVTNYTKSWDGSVWNIVWYSCP